MAILPGTRLGTYEIIKLLGVGGMGEVHRAQDLKLRREVALKFLPEVFARDPERLARFRREAQMLGALNHPNIGAIYNFEETGETSFLVLELVPGETLRERLAMAGPLPLKEVLTIGRQIAAALEAAHEKSIIHRDLKPANVKITPEGLIKVLDFGLAKAFAGTPSGAELHDLTTASMAGTLQGTILGTPAYMSPEQASGKTVDRRTDIWALGCMLYELLSGKQAFQGETITEILASVLRSEPDESALPAATPAQVRILLRRCLEKDSRRRLRDAADLSIQMEEAQTAPPSGPMPVPATLSAVPPVQMPKARLVVALPPPDRLAGMNLPAVAVSPDGTYIAYIASRSGKQQLYVRAIDSLEAKSVPYTEGASGPFFSPDGQWIGFFGSGKLKKVSRSGGSPLTLCDAPEPRGASWGANDNIVFARISLSPLSEVSANGGTPRILTTLKEESSHRWPEILPGGKAVLFTVATTVSNWDAAQIVVQSMETGERHVAVQGGIFGRYAPTGHIIYVRAGTLMAVPFDLNRLQTTGTPTPIVDGVMQSTEGAAQFGISNLGWLVYIPGGIQRVERTLVWVNRKGVGKPLPIPPRAYVSPRLSPDGQRLAVAIQGTNSDVWVYDLSRDTLNRLTFGGLNRWAIWTPDGKRLTFQSSIAGAANLFWMPSDGSGVVERLTTSEHLQTPHCWSPDGSLLAYTEVHPTTGRDIWLLPLEGDPRHAGAESRKPYPFLSSPSNESAPRFSPDGRWLAYMSDESGQFEIYVQAFPGPGGKWQISTEGGTEPVWNPNGKELFYRNGEKLMAVDIRTESGFGVGKPKLLFEGWYERSTVSRPNYDVAADGQRFLMVKPGEQEQPPTQINVVLNWFEELKQASPAPR